MNDAEKGRQACELLASHLRDIEVSIYERIVDISDTALAVDIAYQCARLKMLADELDGGK